MGTSSGLADEVIMPEAEDEVRIVCNIWDTIIKVDLDGKH